MKTTLKRGMGRAAPFNGNGRAVFPPGVRTPMTPVPAARAGAARALGARPDGRRCGRSSSRSSSRAGRPARAYLRAHRFVAAVAPKTKQDKAAANRLDVAVPGQPTTALVIGTDKRRGPEAEVTGRSDTLMLVRADPQTDSISLLSFPRDLLVNIKCPGHFDHVDRINAAFSECGSLGSLLTVRALTGLPINYFITVNFRGFLQLVNNLGGVWVDVDRRYLCDDEQLPRCHADQPAARLPATARARRARVRPFPALRLRPLPRRAAAAVPEGAEAADLHVARPEHGARHRRRRGEERRHRARRQQAARPEDDEGLHLLRARAAAGPHLPVADRRADRVRRAGRAASGVDRDCSARLRPARRQGAGEGDGTSRSGIKRRSRAAAARRTSRSAS